MALLVSNGNTNENYKPLIFSLVVLSIEQHLKTITLLWQQKLLEERDLAAAAAQDLHRTDFFLVYIVGVTKQVTLVT